MMESLELGRRLKRNFDSYFTYRRLCLFIISVLVVFMYIIPYLVKWVGIHRSPVSTEDEIDTCLKDRLTSFYSESFEYNVNIKHVPERDDEKSYVAYVGNGVFGVEINKNSQVYFRQGRSLSLPTFIFPIVYLQNYYMTSYKEAYVTNYLTGIVHVFQCYKGGVYASFQYYAHRTLQSILVQDIKVSNPTDRNFEVTIQSNKLVQWGNSVPYSINVHHGENLVPYRVYSGSVNTSSSENDVVAVSVATRNFPIKIEVEARNSRNIRLLTSLNYSQPIKKSFLAIKKSEIEKGVIESLKKAIGEDQNQLKENHANVWQELWSTGLTIGTSKAKDALNGDKINATMYYVLSQVIISGMGKSILLKLIF